MGEALLVAVGALGGSTWVGFTRTGEGYRLACAGADGGLTVSRRSGAARCDELLTVVQAYFEEALDPPPPDLEATQEDLAGLLGWLASEQADPARRRLLDEAIDAVDDGLAADVVVERLARVRDLSGTRDEQADLLDLLVVRCSGADPARPDAASA